MLASRAAVPGLIPLVKGYFFFLSLFSFPVLFCSLTSLLLACSGKLYKVGKWAFSIPAVSYSLFVGLSLSLTVSLSLLLSVSISVSPPLSYPLFLSLSNSIQNHSSMFRKLCLLLFQQRDKNLCRAIYLNAKSYQSKSPPLPLNNRLNVSPNFSSRISCSVPTPGQAWTSLPSTFRGAGITAYQVSRVYDYLGISQSP